MEDKSNSEINPLVWVVQPLKDGAKWQEGLRRKVNLRLKYESLLKDLGVEPWQRS